MGYTLTIGEFELDFDTKDEDCPHISLDAKMFKHDDAPAFGEPTDNESQRWPSYTSWSDFCRFSGLYDLFYGKNEARELTRDDALLHEHPGCIPLTEKQRREVNEAYEAFKKKYPNAKPTYGDIPKGSFDGDPNNPEENGQMCRLVWLHYWVNWALDNCKQPVFANS